ncbi:hypothetical protein [Leptospira perdikensis]|uniref:hypothetical protein n=1 Tax=Leptospira perdikensis TaxID=2484948 RepID=UPI001ABF2851|nr:hypothetical protein [Leptospira perdikensis]
MFQKLSISILLFVFLSCASRGIPLESRSHLKQNSKLECQTSETEIRTFRILFLLPFYRTNTLEITNNDYVVETKSYAKPLDIGFTFLGFLFSLNSSTDYILSCPWNQVEKSVKAAGEGDGILEKSKLAFWKSVGSADPIESVSFEPDDHRLTDESQNELSALGQKILKSEEKMQIVLYGKVNTTGDVGFQIRLLKRRFDEIKTLMAKESLDVDLILPIIGEKDSSGDSKLNSSVQIYLVKN